MNRTTETGDAWARFVAATDPADFAGGWLALLCEQIGGASAGVVLLESSEAHTFVPIAVWPRATPEIARLGAVAQRALAERRGVVQRDEPLKPAQIAYPIEASGRVVGAVALEIAAAGELAAELRQLHWGIGWLRELLLRRELAGAEARTARVGSIMEAIATSLRPAKLQETLFEITNHLARHLGCSRVGIGLTDGPSIRLAALSDAAWFERDSALARRYVDAMEEALDLRAAAIHPSPSGASSVPSGQARLAGDSGAAAVLSMPLLSGGQCAGVITLEKSVAFAADEIAWVDAFAGLLAPVIDQKQRAERGYAKRLQHDARALLERWFGPRHLVWKFATSMLLLVVAILVFVQVDYRVTARTVIEGEVQRVAVAPFDGFIAASPVRAGDTVRAGQVLCEMDDRDLKVELARWTSERDQSDKKLREAMSARNFAEVQIASAQRREAEAQLGLVNERLRRARIVAPFDGVVLSGDLSQLIGSPVEQGKKLFEIAPLASYRVILQVDEREIGHVAIGQQGELVIAGIAGDPTPFDVVTVTPVATAEDGRNFFRVEALLHEAPPRLRPGMEGVGKIEVGGRRLWWILTHGFTDWLRLKLWTWTL